MEDSEKNATELTTITSDADLLVYRAYVEQMFQDRSEDIISNRNTAHAKVLIETLVDHSQNRLDIFCENLCSKVYGSIGMALKLAEALNRGVKIRILTQAKPQSETLEHLLGFLSTGGNKAEFRLSPSGGVGVNADFNFVVSDESAFRFETDREKHIASACANNQILAQKISQRFELIWSEARKPAL